MSVLELFDPGPIAEAFTEHSYRFGQLPVRIPQRRFVDEEERDGVLENLRRGQIVAPELRDRMFASLCIAAYPKHFDELQECVANIGDELPSEGSAVASATTVLLER